MSGHPPLIVALAPDLLVGLPIRNAARRVGMAAEVVATGEEALERLRDARAALLVIDTSVTGLDLKALADAARVAGARVIAFGPHVDAARRREARAAGILAVYPRGRFLQNLPRILAERTNRM